MTGFEHMEATALPTEPQPLPIVVIYLTHEITKSFSEMRKYPLRTDVFGESRSQCDQIW